MDGKGTCMPSVGAKPVANHTSAGAAVFHLAKLLRAECGRQVSMLEVKVDSGNEVLVRGPQRSCGYVVS